MEEQNSPEIIQENHAETADKNLGANAQNNETVQATHGETAREQSAEIIQAQPVETAATNSVDEMQEKPEKHGTAEKIKEFLLMNAGALLLAAGVYFFKSTNNFVTGGVSGLSILLAKVITVLSQAQIMLIINVLLLLVGFVFLGKGCTVKTVYCSLIYSLETYLFEVVCPLDGPLTNQTLLELVYAILLTGVGSAIIFNANASSGGTDIIALILKKYTRLNVGRALLVTDIIIAVSSFFVFDDISTGLYSVLGLFAKAFLIDGVIEDIGKNKYITVITTRPREIGEYILNVMDHSFTSYPATGGYTGESKTVMITVCHRAEAFRLKSQVKKMDPAAFVIITDANEILGKGFRGVSST